MKIFDVSVEIKPGMVCWPGSAPVKFLKRKSISRGDSSNNTNITLNAHAGTHVDAPLHFLKSGKSIDDIPLLKLMGRVYVKSYPNVKEIGGGILDGNPPPAGCSSLLVKTSNSTLWKNGHKKFYKKFAAFTEDGARWLVKRGIKLVGIDYLSVQKYGDSPAVHRILLSAGIVVIEGLDLSGIKDGWYNMVCFPLKFAGIEASPARVILTKG